MNKVKIAAVVGILLAVSGVFYWLNREPRQPIKGEAEQPICFVSENPNEGALQLDMLLRLQLGRDLQNEPQLPPMPEDKIAAETNDYFLVNCAAPPNCDIGREQAQWPEVLRPKFLYVDKATRKLIGGCSESPRRISRKDQMQELIAVAVLLEKGGFTATNMRQKDNRMAYDLVDPFGRKSVLSVTTFGNGTLHWAQLNYFAADSCLGTSEMNRIPQPTEMPEEEMKKVRKAMGVEW